MQDFEDPKTESNAEARERACSKRANAHTVGAMLKRANAHAAQTILFERTDFPSARLDLPPAHRAWHNNAAITADHAVYACRADSIGSANGNGVWVVRPCQNARVMKGGGNAGTANAASTVSYATLYESCLL